MPFTSRVLDRQRVRSLEEYVDLGGGIAAQLARQASPDEVVDLLRSSGLRGRGGAGFPTGAKWETVAASRSLRDLTTIVVNAAEGEPGTFKDRALLRTNPYRVLEGAIIAATTLQSDQIRVGIKGTFGREVDRLTTAIAEMTEAGWLRGLDIQLVLGPSSYLFGEETALLEVIEGRQPFPRVTPPYRRGLHPADTRSAVGTPLATIGGGRGAPALVDNVETLANVPLIVEHGAEWFREVGTERSPGTIVATVSGATRRSAVGEVAMGSTLREVIDIVGWGPRPGHEIRVVLAGTANALIPSDLLDTPLTYEAMREAGTGLGSAGFIVFDDTTEPTAVAAGVLRFLSVESCGQCEPCKSDGLQIAGLLRRSLQEPSTAVDGSLLRRRINTVAIGARCNLAQQQATVGSSLLELFPQVLDARPRASLPSAAAPVEIAPIVDLVSGRAILDTLQLTKQPDWSYGDDDSGAAPAARLGNTPVHVSGPDRLRTWPEWAATVDSEQPLEIIDGAHDAIDALIDDALAEEEGDRDDRVREVAIAVRTHVDVTRRVLFPMLRRVGEEEGDRLADAAEAQERTLLDLVDGIDAADPRGALQDIGVAMHDHAAIGDEILELLRAQLDPVERASLADGLAVAESTSTVTRLFRSASKVQVAASKEPPAQRDQRSAVDGPAAGSAVAREAAPLVPANPIGDDPVPVELPDRPAVVRPRRRRASALARMLVGVDGSPAAAAALRWAGRLAARVDAEVVVANVFEPDQAEVSPEVYPKLLAGAEQVLSEWAAPLVDTGVRHRCVQLTGPPDTLLAAARSARADLLVVGTRGAGRHAALHLGSLAHHLAHHTDDPLVIVPLLGAETEVDRIVLGIDGSEGSAAAVSWCAGVAAAVGAEVLAVCAIEPRVRRSASADRWRETAEAAISSESVAPLRAAGVTVRIRVVDGAHPLAALAAAAAEEDAGLVVVGTRGRREIGGVRLGRLPLQLVHHTHVPVALVPPPQRRSTPTS